ncbi:MAG: hypothetical protein HRT68_16750 [Flavobacteriaceae bacterium]|nr:hypothetical protein [Flavobacteriaceae bacterium]
MASSLTFKYMRTCLKAGIKIYPVLKSKHSRLLKIHIDNNGELRKGTEIYEPKEVYKKILSLYKEIYIRKLEPQGISLK